LPSSDVRCAPVLALVVALAAGCPTRAVPGVPGPVGSSGPVWAAPAAASGRCARPWPGDGRRAGRQPTAGAGDDAGQGFVGRITEAVTATPGREGSTLVNFGQSGWTSTELIDGQQGTPGELKQDVVAARAAPPGSVLATC